MATLPTTAATAIARKTLLVTGCNSGIGFNACQKFAADQERVKCLILVARSLEKAQKTKQDLLSSLKSTTKGGTSTDESGRLDLIPMSCDISSFASIREFSSKLHGLMRERPEGSQTIDVVCLNAGVCAPGNSSPPQFINPHKQTTEKKEDDDGDEREYEISFATNHLGTFFLTHCIHDLITPEGGRVVVTASSLHSKERNGYTPSFNDFVGAIDKIDSDGSDTTFRPKNRILTLNDRKYDNMEAYAISKLCNVTFTMDLNQRLAQKAKKESDKTTNGKGIVVNCFCPGFIPSTGLARHVNSFLVGAFSLFANYIAKFADTVDWGGGTLAYMALAEETGLRGGECWKAPPGISHKGGTYEKDFKPIDVNPEALEEKNQSRLWQLSCSICGISKDEEIL